MYSFTSRNIHQRAMPNSRLHKLCFPMIKSLHTDENRCINFDIYGPLWNGQPRSLARASAFGPPLQRSLPSLPTTCQPTNQSYSTSTYSNQDQTEGVTKFKQNNESFQYLTDSMQFNVVMKRVIS